jgi:hypothetical protein
MISVQHNLKLLKVRRQIDFGGDYNLYKKYPYIPQDTVYQRYIGRTKTITGMCKTTMLLPCYFVFDFNGSVETRSYLDKRQLPTKYFDTHARFLIAPKNHPIRQWSDDEFEKCSAIRSDNHSADMGIFDDPNWLEYLHADEVPFVRNTSILRCASPEAAETLATFMTMREK